MPGPRNQKKKSRPQNKKGKKVQTAKPLDSSATKLLRPLESTPSPTPVPETPPPPLQSAIDVSIEVQHHTHPYPPHIYQEDFVEPPIYPLRPRYPLDYCDVDESPVPPLLLKTPFIYDPGNGPRVKDTRAFLASSFASPPSLDDPLCAEFAEEAVLQMLCRVLPEETAMILWYNKSRHSSRICPACQRLYRLGDVLPDHLVDEDQREGKDPQASPYLAREQELSGLCSPVCFILASYNYPGAISSTWGRMAEELDDATWDLLDGPGQNANDMGLGMLLKMTRCHDLGLGQLFFPDLDLDPAATCDEAVPEGLKWELGNDEQQMQQTRVLVEDHLQRLQLDEEVRLPLS